MKLSSKYEYARIIGARALQLSLGAPPTIKLKGISMDSIKVAVQEFEEGVLPLAVIKN